MKLSNIQKTNIPLSIPELKETLAAEGLHLPEDNPVLNKVEELQGTARIEIDRIVKGILLFVPPDKGEQRQKWVARICFSENGFGATDISNFVETYSKPFKNFLDSLKRI